MVDTTEKTIIKRIDSRGVQTREDLIIRELPLTIMVNNEELVTMLCSPVELNYLACGFLLSEGIIRSKEDIKDITTGRNNNYINIELKNKIQKPGELFQKRVISSGCGRGSYFYDSQDIKDCKPIESAMRAEKDDILAFMKELNNRSELFKATGGVHSAALATISGLEVFSEDIGRHNAIDKIFGKCLLESIDTAGKMALTTGRVSSEIIVKVIKRGIPIIVSRSAPTDMAVKLAKKMSVTLAGFARGRMMNVYTHADRII